MIVGLRGSGGDNGDSEWNNHERGNNMFIDDADLMFDQ